ncbi:uncharacterized protein LOC103715639 [Phoenix dactylifera]|uniref:Uncharacterized protein LOC103715639 n=1 Tax=Phoenix dactylifera TaxID=42345 RepID=A0A8B7CLA5_PHODC|nr:uncharacterized protein LOC103715639 [Phoenix dactylifera]
MEWWHRVVVPVKRALIALAARIRPRKDGGGILKLHNDVQSCGYRDVEVMWELLQRSEEPEPELSHSSKKRRPVGRVSVWSGRT